MDETRQKILSIADQLFMQYGIKSVSIDDLCKQLGMSKKTFYTYYAQKEDLIEAILSMHREKGHQCMMDDLGKHTTQKRIMLLQETLNHLDDVRKAPPLVFDLQKYYPTLFKKHIELIQEEVRQDMQLQLQQGIDEGLFRSDIDIELTADFFATIHHMMMDVSRQPNAGNRIRTAVEIVVRGILSQKGLEILTEVRKNK